MVDKNELYDSYMNQYNSRMIELNARGIRAHEQLMNAQLGFRKAEEVYQRLRRQGEKYEALCKLAVEEDNIEVLREMDSILKNRKGRKIHYHLPREEPTKPTTVGLIEPPEIG